MGAARRRAGPWRCGWPRPTSPPRTWPRSPTDGTRACCGWGRHLRAGARARGCLRQRQPRLPVPAHLPGRLGQLHDPFARAGARGWPRPGSRPRPRRDSGHRRREREGFVPDPADKRSSDAGRGLARADRESAHPAGPGRGAALRPVPWPVDAAWTALWCLLGGLLALKLDRPLLLPLAAVLGAGLLVATATAALASGYWIALVPPLFGAPAALLLEGRPFGPPRARRAHDAHAALRHPPLAPHCRSALAGARHPLGGGWPAPDPSKRPCCSPTSVASPRYPRR